MDALFTLPALSLFLIPTIASYSTSLNLIFFYMTWMTLVLSHTPLRVELFGTAAVRLLFYVLPSLLFFLFDILTPSAAVVIKAHGELGLPAGSKRSKIRAKDLKVAGWALANLTLSIITQAAIEEARTSILGMRSALKVSMKLPMPWEIVKDLLRGLFAREALAYTIHRYVLHSRQYSVAKYHETWYHSLRAPFPLTAHYDHPAAYLLANFVPTYAPAMFFRFHMLTYLLYLSVISIEETFAFSGYSVMPTSFFLGGIARHTDVHLLSGAEGNFAPWGILDWMCGTTVGDAAEEDVSVALTEETLSQDGDMDEKIRRAVEESTRRFREERRRLRRRRREE
ncbi:sterol desaturase family protein [Aspergillus clavatus NRRL 1]|uniref:Sterol desaturase family n=1 Tax=Aspergillus clavatus (strain ATCC 1007 / CBS 513.65 / DSM 816 / NCTC 3887 / NRRL 1 / QM 1276 / 107) TaxID=344612 RepID=A1CQ05_ASPCL|nr:Sterol desaturase family [Aspergillus clavatus NRRL 1]EAW07726.1 Sterol desaturase family [Aspergillus clavatus NRRL 1]